MQTRDAFKRLRAQPGQDPSWALGDAIVDSADDAIISKTLDGVIQSWNRGAERLFGYPAGEAIGQPVTMLIPASRRDEEVAILARIGRGERIEQYETVRRTKDAREIPVSLTVSPIKDSRGTVIGVSKIARDISERRETERTRAVLAAIVDSAHDAIISKSLEGVIQSWNRGAERLFGYTAQEAVGKPITLLIPAERQHEEPEILARLRRGERVDHFETVRIAKDGRHIPISLTVSPVRDGRGAIIGASKIARDISAQKEAEALRRGRAAELGAIIEAVPVPVLIAEDTDCRTVRANRDGYALLRAWGGKPAEEPALPPDASNDRVLTRDVRVPVRLGNLQRAARGEAIRNWEETVTLADGTAHHFIGNAVPLLDEHGRARGAVAAFIDISERKKSENALREADRHKDEFLAMLAHELRNPLTPIRTGLDIIQRNLGDANRREWALQVVDRQLVQLTRVIDDLLDLARVVNGNITLHKEAIRLSAVVSNAVETNRALINSRRQVLRVGLPREDVLLYVDPVRTAQAISNLLSNAGKYTEPGGTIAVDAETREGTVALRVRDTGRGIEEGLLPHVFDVFAQGKRDLARTEGGLGVGLSIVRRVVELHGGSVSACSKGKGKGSEFVIKLPIASPDALGANPAGQKEGPFRTRRVLLVDDNRDITDSIAELLLIHGHEVEKLYDGHGVLEKAMAFKPDVLVVDLGLPGKDGFEVTHEIRAHPELRGLPIIAISGYGQPADVERSRSAGMNFHLLKPVDIQLLMKLIEANIGRLNG